MEPTNPKNAIKRELMPEALIRELAAAVKGEPRKGSTFQTGRRSKHPRNIASRKPVKRHD